MEMRISGLIMKQRNGIKNPKKWKYEDSIR